MPLITHMRCLPPPLMYSIFVLVTLFSYSVIAAHSAA